MSIFKFTSIILLSFLLISCGFHLRGNQDLSNVLPELNIVGVTKNSTLDRELKRALENAKVNIVEESKVTLTIDKSDFSKRVLSIDSTGRANQYELTYVLSFMLAQDIHNKDESPKVLDMLPKQSITEKREYLFDANLVLAKADEESRLQRDMQQAAMLQLVRRLTFLLKSGK